MKRVIPGLLSLLVMAAACQVDSTDNTCQTAADHIADCSGVPAVLGDGTCNVSEAQSVLDMSCSELTPPSDPGKADFWGNGNPLCLFLTPVTSVASGGVCCFDYNCTGEDICRGYRCKAQSQKGESCERNNHCVDGLNCGPSKVCQAPATEGENCTVNSQCHGNLSCIAGRCLNPNELGGSCDANDDSDCTSGLICHDGICAEHVKDGDTCKSNSECEGFLTCIQGQCQSESTEGGACDGQDGSDCEFGLYCIAESCSAPPAIGEACERDPFWMCGDGNTCWNGSCEPRHPKGGACEGMFDCESGLFCSDGTCDN